MSNKPNIIYILSDQHRGQAMTHTGDVNIKTPNMDKLANEGISFQRAYSNCPVCTPSRGTIFSGRYAHSGPVSNFNDAFKIAGPSSATMLRNSGYHTAYVGKWHLGGINDQKPKEVYDNIEYYKYGKRTPESRRAGFQDWYGYEVINFHFNPYYYKNHDVNPTKMDGYATDTFTDLTIDYLNNYDKDEPLFLVHSVEPPHFPLLVPEKWERFDKKTLKVRDNFTDTEEMRTYLSKYYAMIENLDYNIGRLVDAIRSNPKFEDTIIVYLSDHGDFMGSHNRESRKEHPQEESVSIPLIFNWQGKIKPQGLNKELISTVDILPTTLGLANLNVPSSIQGRDYSKMMLNNEKMEEKPVLIEMVGNPRWSLDFKDFRGIVENNIKYVFYEDGEELLFDLENDPYELNNIAGENIELKGEMKIKLLELLNETREPYFDVVMNETFLGNEEDVDVAYYTERHPGMPECGVTINAR